MIKSERQYKITRAKADEARVAISELDNTPLPDGLSAEMCELQLKARPECSAIAKPSWTIATNYTTPR